MSKNTVVTMAAGVAFLLLGCGAEVDGSPSGAPSAEETQPAELTYDQPMVAAVRVTLNINGTADLWVFACSSGMLRRNTAREADVPSWRGWLSTGHACRGTPTAAVAGSNTAVNSVIVYFRRDDNHLMELWWPTAVDSPQFADITPLAGLGAIAGSPTIVYARDRFDEVSVVVRMASDNSLHTADYYAGAWHRNVVHNGLTPSGRGDTGAIRSANTVRGLSNVLASSSLSKMSITGRGLTASDDVTGWVATRTGRGSFTRDLSIRDFRPTGTPAIQPWYPNTSASLVANFNGKLRYLTFGGRGVWEDSPCSAGGSPVPAHGGFGFMRSGNGLLMQYANFEPCTERNFALLSAPAVVGSHAFYIGAWAELFHYSNEKQQSMGINVP
jgi:hypothetical protein